MGFCLGWKNPNPPSIPPRPDAPTPTASTSDPCRTCNHPLSDHITHLQHPVSLSKLGQITNLIFLRFCNTVAVAAKCDHIGLDHN